MRRAVIGVDGGGTHSRGVLLSLEGELLAAASSGPSNYLSVGRAAATRALASIVSELTAAAGAGRVQIAAAGFGLSGLDRPKDADVFSVLLKEAGTSGWPCELVNDAYLALRAGTVRGTGVVAVAGTGCNTVGVDARGRRERVGGLAYELGDFGGAVDLGVAALRAAFRGEDGRGPGTQLGQRIRRALGVDRLDALLDRLGPDTSTPLAPAQLAPVVFEVAAEGDEAALGILREAGRELGRAARLVAERLFADDDAFPLVMGGRVLSQGQCDAMRDALVHEVRARFFNADPVRLDVDPVLGAALLAIDRVAPEGWPDEKVFAAARAALKAAR